MTSQVRVAVVGCGYWGKNLVRDFSQLGALEALVDANAETVAGLQAKHGGRALDYAEALADPVIDGIVIAAPAHLHYDLARKALEAGKHVYVEKPLALELVQGEELVRLAERYADRAAFRLYPERSLRDRSSNLLCFSARDASAVIVLGPAENLGLGPTSPSQANIVTSVSAPTLEACQ